MAGNYRMDMSIEEILSVMDDSRGNTEKIYAGLCFVQFKLHQESLKEQRTAQETILTEQRNFQVEYLSKTASLVKGTWALVLVTFTLVIAPLVLPLLRTVFKLMMTQ